MPQMHHDDEARADRTSWRWSRLANLRMPAVRSLGKLGREIQVGTPGRQLCLRQSTRAQPLGTPRTTAIVKPAFPVRPRHVICLGKRRRGSRRDAPPVAIELHRGHKGARKGSKIQKKPARVDTEQQSQRGPKRPAAASDIRPLRQRDGQAAKGDRPKAQNHDLFEKGSK